MVVEVVETPELSPEDAAEADRIANRLADAFKTIMAEEEGHKKPLNVGALIEAQAQMLGRLIAGAPIHIRGALVAMVMATVAKISGGHAIVAEIGSQPPPKGN